MMTNNNVFSLYQGLQEVGGLKGVKFSYAVAKNLTLLDAEIKSLKAAVVPSKEYSDYDNARLELCKLHAKKDEHGKPVSIGNQFDIENLAEFEKEFEALKEKNKEVLNAREAQLKEFQTLLEAENPIKLHKISKDDLPQDISAAQLTSIFQIIEE